MIKKVLVALSISIALAAIAVIGVELTLRTAWGREKLADELEEIIEDQIPGSLEIGAIERYRFGHVVAKAIEFTSPDGETVIEVARAEARLALLPLLWGKLAFEGVRARGATVVIAPGRRALSTSIAETFKESEDAGGALDVDTGTMHFERTSLVLAMGKPRVRFDRLEGFARVIRPSGKKAKVRLDRVKGVWSLPDFPKLGPKREFHASGVVDVEAEPMVDVVVRACFDDGELPIALRLTPSRDVRLDYRPGEAGAIEFFLRLADRFSGDHVTVDEGEVDLGELAACGAISP